MLNQLRRRAAQCVTGSRRVNVSINFLTFQYFIHHIPNVIFHDQIHDSLRVKKLLTFSLAQKHVMNRFVLVAAAVLISAQLIGAFVPEFAFRSNNKDEPSFIFEFEEANPGMVAHFLVNASSSSAPKKRSHSLPFLDGLQHFRNLPGTFYRDVNYHFDGFATILKFEFTRNQVSVQLRPFNSPAYRNYPKCSYIGNGSGPKIHGLEFCLTNPGVNLLPIDDENLWLTIDTALWGLVDPRTLETKPGFEVDVPAFTLNAHPACVYQPGGKGIDCFVEHACSRTLPISREACISKLIPVKGGGLTTEMYSRVTLPSPKLIQHSHAPCITENFIVVKLDAFKVRSSRPPKHAAGLLSVLQQEENSLFMIMDRRDNSSKIIRSNVEFVNNHFWNCFEERGQVVVDAIPATERYLDQYFKSKLELTTQWNDILVPPYRCTISMDKMDRVVCSNLLQDTQLYLDYPTFNPLVKTMNTTYYKHFYAIAPTEYQSQWFNQIVKVDTRTGRTVDAWKEPGVYVTEAGFVPTSEDISESDDFGVLLSVVYDSNKKDSLLVVVDARTMETLEKIPLNMVIPFHAHGVSRFNDKWFTNP